MVRDLWIQFKLSRVKVCVVEGYCPNEGNGIERERFWKDSDWVVDKIDNGYILCVLKDLNGWIVDRVRAGITGTFEVPGENDNEEWWSSMLEWDCV